MSPFLTTLKRVLVTGLLLLHLFPDVSFAAAGWWSLGNQMKIEKRPYTTPNELKPAAQPGFGGPTFSTTRDKLLQSKLREMHRVCDGQCFYAPSTCDTKKYECELAASVAMHNEDVDGELYCDIFGQDPIRESFCSRSEAQMKYREESGKSDVFYTITLHRILGSPQTWGVPDYDGPLSSCYKKWDDETGRRCRLTEFVAISFVNPNAPGYSRTPDLHPEDLWYICAADEPRTSRVQMWTKVSDDPTIIPVRIRKTKPHPNGGMGVIFSKGDFDEDTVSMGCQFVIQESNMTLEAPDTPLHAAFFKDKDKDTIEVKLGSGYVHRDPDNDTILRPFFTGYLPLRSPPIPHSLGIYKLFSGSKIKPTNKVNFHNLKVELKSHPTTEYAPRETNHRQQIEDVLNKCDVPGTYTDWYIACYPPNSQLNCVHTGHCPVMFIVEVPRVDRHFERIKAHVYSMLPDDKSLRKTSRRPLGFASVAFSFDNKMGRDVVITCHANGLRDVRVNVSINFGKANIFPGKVNYDNLIYNTKGVGTAESNQIMCSWEMKTSFVVNMFSYEPDYKYVINPGQSEKLEFDLTKDPVYLLTAAGNRNYPKGKIVYHDYRQVLIEKFGKDLFYEKASGTMVLAGFASHLSWLSVLCYFFYLV